MLSDLQKKILQMIYNSTGKGNSKSRPLNLDILRHKLTDCDETDIITEREGLIKEGLVSTVSFHNWLVLTDYGIETFKSSVFR